MLGHGPHVPRGMEIYRGRLIAYSLGNFATYYGIRVTGDNGLAPLLVATLAADGSLVSGRIHSFRQQRPSGPLPDATDEAYSLIRRLSESDFPESAPAFRADGTFWPRSAAAQSSGPG